MSKINKIDKPKIVEKFLLATGMELNSRKSIFSFNDKG